MRYPGRSEWRRGNFLQILGAGLLVACSGPGHTTVGPQSQSGVTPFEIRVWSDKGEYRIGEPIELFVVGSADAYVTLIEIDASGASHVLFPNEFGTENFLVGGRRHEIPAQNAEFRFSVEGPAGTGQIRAVATRRPLTPGSERSPDSSDDPLGEGSTEITIIDDDRDGSSLRERTIKPKRPEKPIDIIGVPGNRPNLAQGQDEHHQLQVLPR